MNIQDEVRELVNRLGGLWSRDKILLKLTEELGELTQAFRKKDRAEQVEEFGDILFSLCCLAERETFSLEHALRMAITKHEEHWGKIKPSVQ